MQRKRPMRACIDQHDDGDVTRASRELLRSPALRRQSPLPARRGLKFQRQRANQREGEASTAPITFPRIRSREAEMVCAEVAIVQHDDGAEWRPSSRRAGQRAWRSTSRARRPAPFFCSVNQQPPALPGKEPVFCIFSSRSLTQAACREIVLFAFRRISAVRDNKKNSSTGCLISAGFGSDQFNIFYCARHYCRIFFALQNDSTRVA